MNILDPSKIQSFIRMLLLAGSGLFLFIALFYITQDRRSDKQFTFTTQSTTGATTSGDEITLEDRFNAIEDLNSDTSTGSSTTGDNTSSSASQDPTQDQEKTNLENTTTPTDSSPTDDATGTTTTIEPEETTSTTTSTDLEATVEDTTNTDTDTIVHIAGGTAEDTTTTTTSTTSTTDTQDSQDEQNGVQEPSTANQQTDEGICGAAVHIDYIQYMDSESLQISDPELCVEGSVSNFTYRGIHRGWTRYCRGENSSVACRSAPATCGDGVRDIAHGEVCDGDGTLHCDAAQVCDQTCKCSTQNNATETTAPSEQDTNTETTTNAAQAEAIYNVQNNGLRLCGNIDETIVYEQDGNGLSEDTIGLCRSGTMENFVYDAPQRLRGRECKTDTQSQSCSAQSARCGDGELHEKEECDDDLGQCGAYEICSSVCSCEDEPIPGVCGEAHLSSVYATKIQAGDIASYEPTLCDEGKVQSFKFHEDNKGWTRTCAGHGGADHSTCRIQGEWCGDLIVNGDEQCDDGNQAGGDGCDHFCRSETLLGYGVTIEEGCGNGEVEIGEQCDDGNILDYDGCASTCLIEDGWKCDQQSPSKCGSRECADHGEWYSQYDLFGTCCGGLDQFTFEHIPDKIIAPGVFITMCFDEQVDLPFCMPDAATPGRYVQKQDKENFSLIVKDSCDRVYTDYYKTIKGYLKEQRSNCQYHDDDYDRIEFKDIASSGVKEAVEALQYHCIVSGVGSKYSYFRPKQNIKRAEFAKMLIKILNLGQDRELQQESRQYNGNTYYDDVAAEAWYAQYVAKVYEQGILDPIRSLVHGSSFAPYKSMSKKEIIKVLYHLDAGQDLDEETMSEILGDDPTPSRGSVAELLVQKFQYELQDYFYLQGNNADYLETLLEKIRGKKYVEQYFIILKQIEELRKKNRYTLQYQYDIHPEGIIAYLQPFIYPEDRIE